MVRGEKGKAEEPNQTARANKRKDKQEREEEIHAKASTGN
jgi:hypothetical protein